MSLFHCPRPHEFAFRKSQNNLKNTLFLGNALPFVEIYVKQRKQKKKQNKNLVAKPKETSPVPILQMVPSSRAPSFQPPGCWSTGQFWLGGRSLVERG